MCPLPCRTGRWFCYGSSCGCRRSSDYRATKNQGYKIKYVRNSQVDIYGPQTFSDYLKQRRRIIAGHYQIRQATGKFSAYILFGILARPRLTVRLLVEYLATTHQIKSGLTLAVVETIANLMAALGVLRGKSHSIWSVCRSTKTSWVLWSESILIQQLSPTMGWSDLTKFEPLFVWFSGGGAHHHTGEITAKSALMY